MNNLSLYRNRFHRDSLERKNLIWKVLCEDFFSKYIKTSDVVIDVGSGYCEFINNIKCAHKIALDINPEVKKFAFNNVQVINDDCLEMASISSSTVDKVFLSNFLEHLPDKKMILKLLSEIKRILKIGGASYSPSA